MKIILTSDIHYGNSATELGKGPFTRKDHVAFAAAMHAEKPDVLIVAGDCAETCLNSSTLKEFLSIYKNPYGESICLPGNHDMWLAPDLGLDAERQYSWFHGTTDLHGWTSLKDRPWSKNGVFVAGNIGWYDYSSRNSALPYTPEDYDAAKAWSDFGRMKIDSALPFCARRMAELETSLSLVPPIGPDRRALIVVTHMVGMSPLMTMFSDDDYNCAFFGNYEIGKMAVKANADLYYCGHSHRFKQFKIGNTICINNGSTYGSKRFDMAEL